MMRCYYLAEKYLNPFLKFSADTRAIADELRKISPEMNIKAISTDINSAFKHPYTVDQYGTCHIQIVGSLSRRVNPCAGMFFEEATTYSEIIEQTNRAEDDESVNEIVYHVNSPGGEVAGVDTAAMIIRQVTKPTSAIVEDMCCSAAYYLASQTGKIIASSPLDEIGSIGVMMYLPGKSDDDSIILTTAKNKNPDPRTDDGLKVYRDRIQSMHDTFVARVVEGRSRAGLPITRRIVESEFGQGGVFSAARAKAVGMIDEVWNPISEAVQ